MADLYGFAIADALRGRPVRLPVPFNPDHLLWRAGEHGLHGLLHEVVARRSDLPGPLKALELPLKAFTMAQEAIVRLRLEAARALAGAFERRGIAAVFIKGAALAGDVYSSPGLRPFSDLDLLVAPGSVARASECLESIGFLEDRTVPTSSMERRYTANRGEGVGVGVDLHWSFVETNGPQAAIRVPVTEILGRVRTVEGIPVPALEDSLLVGAVNLVRSRLDRLVLLADFDRLVRRSPAWDDVFRRARAWGLRTSLWVGLEWSRRILGTPSPVDRLVPPAWQRAWLAGLLEQGWLWSRRKFKRAVWCAVFPVSCADSWKDAAAGLQGGLRRAAPG